MFVVTWARKSRVGRFSVTSSKTAGRMHGQGRAEGFLMDKRQVGGVDASEIDRD